MDLIDIARVAFDAGKIEDPSQLTEDGIALDAFYTKIKGGQLSTVTEADLDAVIPALSRTFIVLGNLWSNKAKHAEILAAIRSL